MNEHRSTPPPSAPASPSSHASVHADSPASSGASPSSPFGGPDGGRRRPGAGRSRRRSGRPLLWAGLAAGVVLVLAGTLVVGRDGEPSATAAAAGPSGGSPAGSSPAAEPPASHPAKATEDVPEPEAEGGGKPGAEAIPSSGPGTFATAGGGGDRVGGTGKILTYAVDVEDGIGIPAEEVAAEVERVFADERGWTADGEVGFRRVSGDTADFRVRLATAGTVDEICGRWGLDTGGEVNCNVGQEVMVNLKRWLLATQYYADDVASYRALIINHEVGHFLGHDHVGCPGAGRPAPVMMQQIKGLHGCRTNVWPYDDERRYVG